MSFAKLFECPCIEIEQPLGAFFVVSMSAEQLEKISFTDVRKLIEGDTDVERYFGIERTLNEQRVRDIAKYAQTLDATFPTSIVVAVDQRSIEYNERTKQLAFGEVSKDEFGGAIGAAEIARVLDGQHRLAGLKEALRIGQLADTPVTFQLSVTVFPSLDIADQAYIFSTVNLAQTKVNRSLAYDLFAYAKSRSPQKTCHNIAVVLNRDGRSPYKGLIKRLGTATPGKQGELLTQATIVQSLIGYISGDAMTDRDLLLRGKSLRRANSDEFKSRPFRNLFIDGKDEIIARIVTEYLRSIAYTWSHAFQSREPGQILARTNGFRAFMRVLGRAYLALRGNDNRQPTESDYASLWTRVPLKDADFNTDRFPPGTSGEAKLADMLRGSIDVFAIHGPKEAAAK